MSTDTSPARRRRGWQFWPIAIFVVAATLCFIGGLSASLFEVFSKSPEAKNSWLLLCGAPCGVVLVLLVVVITLYMRLGRPVRQLFAAINAVEQGNLSVRVPENSSDMYSDLIRRFNKMVGELERAEQQRRNLTADIAHELRTPLHIIQGNIEGILDGVYEATPEHLNNTLDETRLLTRLVDDLQTLSLAEAGQLRLHPTRFQIVELVNDLASSFAAQAATQGIDLSTSMANPNQLMTADYDRLNQVLTNLISNALRHTPAGGAVVMHVEQIPNVQSVVRITVRDTGSGIAPEDLPFVFDRFWRGDRARRERNHSGLGLAITRQLVHAHGGAINVQSEVGRGTTFVIELPQNNSGSSDVSAGP